MPSPSNKNLITAAVAIVKMDSDARETLLLMILEKNPTACITAMSENGVTFGDKINNKATYKVVVTAKSTNKIALIKLFREQTGAGLADSKYWTEGIDYKRLGGMVLPAGVFANGLPSKEMATEIADRINSNTNGIRVIVMNDETPYAADTNWGGNWVNPL